jgi:signal transduction histidine kinase
VNRNRAPGPSRRNLVFVAVLIAVEGIASIRIGYPSFDFRNALLVLATGWAVAGFGLAAWRRVPSSPVGLLLALTAMAWFVGGFAWVALDPAADLFRALALLYAAVAAHAILVFPDGHRAGRVATAAIVATYLAALVPAPRADLLVAIVLVVGLVAVAATARRRRRERRPAVLVGIAFAVALGGYRLLPSLIELGPRLDTRPVLQASLVLVAAVLCLVLVELAQRRAFVADLVIELGSRSRPDLARGLGELVGDPRLQVGFWLPDRGRYVDALGRTVRVPAPGTARVATTIGPDTDPVALLVHDAQIRIDPGITDEVARAASLAAANARLQADVRAQVTDVRASRWRLLVAGDDERRDLERRLRASLEPRLSALHAALSADDLAEDAVARDALEQVAETRAELAELARGIHPMVVEGRGLSGALAELAQRAPVPVEVDIEVGELSSRAVQTQILFIVSEALSNVAKHARPRRAAVRVERDGRGIAVEVSDDGQGGADPDRGSGLHGLRDRVEALGGRISLESRPGQGTRLRAVLPLEEPA